MQLFVKQVLLVLNQYQYGVPRLIGLSEHVYRLLIWDLSIFKY